MGVPEVFRTKVCYLVFLVFCQLVELTMKHENQTLINFCKLTCSFGGFILKYMFCCSLVFTTQKQ